MQPKPQRSEAWSYCFSRSATSGARYHLVPTWVDNLRFFCALRSLFWVIFSTIFFWSVASSIYTNSPSSLRDAIESLSLLEFPLPYWKQLFGNDREIPKSQILTRPYLSNKMLLGFKSLWTIFMEWRNLSAQRHLYTILTIYFSLNFPLRAKETRSLRSYSKYSMTMKMWRSRFYYTFTKSYILGTYSWPSFISLTALMIWISRRT